MFKTSLLALTVFCTAVSHADPIHLDDAMYNLTASGALTANIDSDAPITFPSSVISQGGVNFSYNASVNVNEVSSHVEGTATMRFNNNGGLSVADTVYYQLAAIQIAPTPAMITVIPVLGQATGTATCNTIGNAGDYGGVHSAVSVSITNGPNSLLKRADCNGSFVIDTSQLFNVNQPVFVTKVATASVDFDAAYAGTFLYANAVVDPVFQIDPAFAYADDFALEYSPNVDLSSLPSGPGSTPSAVTPEPPSAVLFALGLLSFAVCRSPSTNTLRVGRSLREGYILSRQTPTPSDLALLGPNLPLATTGSTNAKPDTSHEVTAARAGRLSQENTPAHPINS